jgi:3-methylcrotonyl-CoA carboxylase alpha subunit
VFSKLLIANRGEIAVRVMRTCRRLGIRTVAVYSDADAHALHVRCADEAVRVGPAPASESYLRMDRILDSARRSGAEAVHPGYGFLSENPEFAQACLDAGLIWVGPSPEAMRRLGDKAKAKALAEQVSVPILPGYHGPDQDASTLASQAERLGYPVLIKASAGGGGRGMRIIERPEAFGEALEAAHREAIASFGDGRVLLERYLARPRHVEVQVLGDTHGNLVHLGERECSIQRRHQKLIEESPSVAVNPPLRQAMGEAAVRLAGAAGYTNAGTVEFLLDEQPKKFFFLEVNARLQVEHPVTEFLTGLDLVEQQLRVACGELLSLTPRLEGHAIEVRVVAEDAAFLPSTGRLRAFEPPATVRVDSGVARDSEVSPYYDSLLAKVIAHAPSRADAIQALVHALADFEITGVESNLDLLLATIQTPAFVAGDLHTGFLAEHPPTDSPASIAAIAAAAVSRARPRPGSDPWRGVGPWRLARLDQPVRLEVAGRPVEVFVTRDLETAQSRVRFGEREVLAEWVSEDRVRIDGELARVGPRWVEWHGVVYRVRPQSGLDIEQFAHARVVAGGGGLTAPMPGRVVKLAVAAGDQVSPNQPLVVLEAMKMEHVVEAPHAGVVREVCVEPGQQVAAGALLLELGELE